MANNNRPSLPEEDKDRSPEAAKQHITNARFPQPPRIQRSTSHKETPSGGRSPKHLKETKISYHPRQREVTIDMNVPKKHLDRSKIQRLSG